MSALPKTELTPVEAYLVYERASPTRHEYLDGKIISMTGASRNHNLIVVNIVSSLHPQFRGRSCEAYVNDMRVRVSGQDYVYPDVVVVCGEVLLEDAAMDTLLNPTLIIEVLSPSTEPYDRGKKFGKYRELASLREYVLVSQESAQVEHYLRQGDELWRFSVVKGLEASLSLPAIECILALADVYDKVEFDDESLE